MMNQDTMSEARAAVIASKPFPTPAEKEELQFLEEYLRDKPRLEAEKLKRRGISTATPIMGQVVKAVNSVHPV